MPKFLIEVEEINADGVYCVMYYGDAETQGHLYEKIMNGEISPISRIQTKPLNVLRNVQIVTPVDLTGFGTCDLCGITFPAKDLLPLIGDAAVESLAETSPSGACPRCRVPVKVVEKC